MTTNLVQASTKPILYINGGGANYLSATTLTGLTGHYRDSLNAYDIVVSADVTINAAVIGANGIDAGALANNTWYYVYAIGDASNTKVGAFVISTSATAPGMPDGYNVFRIVRKFRTNGSAQFKKVAFCGSNGNVVVARYDLDTTSSALLAAGAATSYAAVSCVGFSPPGSFITTIEYDYIPQAAGNKATFRPTGSAIAIANTVQFVTGQVATVHISGDLTVDTNSSQSFDYAVGNAGDALTLYAKGYVDFI